MGEFIIPTDQRSLVHLEEQRLTTVWQRKAFTKLMGLQYKICYKKGEDNRAADALSRMNHSPDEYVCAILEFVVFGYANDPQAQQLLAELAIQSPSITIVFAWTIIQWCRNEWFQLSTTHLLVASLGTQLPMLELSNISHG
jgi:hypothetical protein